MRTQEIKCDLPPKLRICPITNNYSKRPKVNNSNIIVHILSTDLDLKDYEWLHAKTHCQTGHQDNIIREPLVVTIITKYHVSKGLKFFGETGVAAVLKELNHLHDRMVVNQKNWINVTWREESGTAIFYVLKAKATWINQGGGGVEQTGEKRESI